MWMWIFSWLLKLNCVGWFFCFYVRIRYWFVDGWIDFRKICSISVDAGGGGLLWYVVRCVSDCWFD